MSLLLAAIPGSQILYFFSSYWLKAVNSRVTEPYLDEYFHVRQAQQYCAGKFDQWDPKITTPPGVYLISWVLFKLGLSCDINALRWLNQMTLVLVMFPVTLAILYVSSRQDNVRGGNISWRTSTMGMIRLSHSALNICLFPPLFFFSALYYTDVTSTCMVLLFTLAFQNRNMWTPGLAILLDLTTFILGALALLFRQTNIFWVAIYPAAVHLRETLLDQSPPAPSSAQVNSAVVQKPKKVSLDLKSVSLLQASQIAFNEQRWHDVQTNEATLQGFILMLVTAIPCATSNLLAMSQHRISKLIRTWPYALLLAAFAAFVAWNGGVVLGDKSNHVATIHAPQMLYIWPFITFFSLPLVAPALLGYFQPLSDNLPALRPFKVASNVGNLAICITICLITSLAAVHYNTIVHPFTLADNRHYVFYVFRLLLRHTSIRYLASMVYTVSAIGCFTTLNRPKVSAQVPSPRPISLMWFIIWVASTALCLITAPLVEPRYYIIPWIFWRLNIPFTDVHTGTDILFHGDWRLHAETLWFAAINAWTMYMFLDRPFEWPQEPGTLQRFMW